MMNLLLHSLQPSHGGVNFILAQLYVGVYNASGAIAIITRKVPIGLQRAYEDVSLARGKWFAKHLHLLLERFFFRQFLVSGCEQVDTPRFGGSS